MVSFKSPFDARIDGGGSTDHWRAMAIRALGFVSNDRQALDRFLADAGLSRADLLRQPIAVRHLTAVLDFLITNEAALNKFSRAVDMPMEAAYEARRALASSGELTHVAK